MSEIAVQQLNFNGTLLLPEDIQQQEATTRANSEIDQRANPSLLHKIGELVTNAAATVQEGINSLAIRTQIAGWQVEDYLQHKGSKLAAHAGLALLALGGAGLGALKESSTAYAETNQANYQIVDGPWYLHDPNGPPQIASTTIGLAQTGDTITITCHETGDNVSGDAEWDLVTDQNNDLTGLVADFGTSTPVQQGQEASQLTALGIPECGTGTTTGQMPNAPTSIFFSPIYGQADGLPLLPNVASLNYAREDWSSGDCSDDKMQQLIQTMPSTVNTLAGWSRGRMGPAYFLETASQPQVDQIHTIILFDPGDTSSFTNGGCETDQAHPHDVSALYASWLSSNSQNRLIVYTGIDSEEGSPGPNPQPFQEQLQDGTLQQQPYIDNETFAGLWKYYFADIWANNNTLRNQAQVCDYNGMSHDDVLRNFAYTVQNPISSCPVAADGQQPVAWNP